VPPKKIVLEPSYAVLKLPSPIGSEFDGIRKRLTAKNVEVIDLGRIAPPVPQTVTDLLAQSGPPRPIDRVEALEIETRLKERISDWMHSRFEVRLEPETEILLTTGNTPGIFYAFQSFVNPGERVFLPDPSFSLYRSSAAAVGADIHTYELSPRTDYLPNLDKLKDAGSKASKLMLINYPHNPTSAVADESFYERFLRFAQKNNVLILSDAVYSTQVWERHTHPAMIGLPKAKFKTVELFTFSFMFGFPLLKLGFAVGCKEFLSPLGKVFQSFNSRPSGCDLQIAEVLLDEWDKSADLVAASLGENRHRFEKGIRPLGWELQPSHASPFVWIKLPRRRLSLNFCRMLLKRTGVVTLPGISFGEKGEGFMRISLAVKPESIDAAVSRIMEHSKFYQGRYRKKKDTADG
jgi:aspartate/methionine/tyrosine aminotransferase